jgi:hypothetical protein
VRGETATRMRTRKLLKRRKCTYLFFFPLTPYRMVFLMTSFNLIQRKYHNYHTEKDTLRKIKRHSTGSTGRAIAQVVSRRISTTVARVRARFCTCGICGGQSGSEAGFLWVLRFPLPNFIPPIAPQSPSSIIWGLYNRPAVTAVPSGLSLAPQSIIKRLKTGIITLCTVHQ